MLRKYIPLALSLAIASALGFFLGAFAGDQPGAAGPAKSNSHDEESRAGKGTDGEEAKENKPKEEKPEKQSYPRVAHVFGQ